LVRATLKNPSEIEERRNWLLIEDIEISGDVDETEEKGMSGETPA